MIELLKNEKCTVNSEIACIYYWEPTDAVNNANFTLFIEIEMVSLETSVDSQDKIYVNDQYVGPDHNALNFNFTALHFNFSDTTAAEQSGISATYIGLLIGLKLS